ncbi:MAG: hypothetical protein WBM28_14620 [Burkholderiales bacterium]
MVSQPARFSLQREAAPSCEPLLGEHTAEVLRGLGIDGQELEALERDGAI